QAIKSVIIKTNGKFIMCVLPAVRLVDLSKVKSLLKVKETALATEGDLAKLFPDYDIGAEPPFGQIYGLEVYADQGLDPNLPVIFNAGTHTDTVRMKYADYMRIAKPKVADISKPL